jgi:hypothetical protein
MYLIFISLTFLLVVFRLFPDAVALFRLRPRPRNFPIKFCADSDKCFKTTSAGFTSGDVFSAKSNKILTPGRIVSWPSVLAPLQRMGLIRHQKPVKILPIPCLRLQWVERNKLVLWCYHHKRDRPGESSTVQCDSLFVNA